MDIKTEELYESIEISERQIEEGKIKDAEESLNKLKEKYNL